MRNVVFEGPDAGGKSTLIAFINMTMKRPIIDSPGPLKSANEFEQLALQMVHSHGVLFDRHPCISERIYGLARKNCLLPAWLEKNFYDTNPLIVYCEPSNRRHTVKAHDSEEHLALLRQQQVLINDEYRKWALSHAHLLYRIGDDKEQLLKMILSCVPANITESA